LLPYLFHNRRDGHKDIQASVDKNTSKTISTTLTSTTTQSSVSPTPTTLSTSSVSTLPTVVATLDWQSHKHSIINLTTNTTLHPGCNFHAFHGISSDIVNPKHCLSIQTYTPQQAADNAEKQTNLSEVISSTTTSIPSTSLSLQFNSEWERNFFMYGLEQFLQISLAMKQYITAFRKVQQFQMNKSKNSNISKK
jgi:hypothetical protein